MTPPGFSKGVKILHPLDALATGPHYLADISDKRDAHGVARGRLAIGIVRAFIAQAHAALRERDVFPCVEEVRRIALNKKISGVCYEHGFDVLSKRWPQILARRAQQCEVQPS